MNFSKAERKKAKLRLALTGVSGSGKTYSALQVATGLGGKIAVIDTEHGSSSLYSDRFDFDVLDLEAPYSPERFIEAITLAEKAGYDTLIIDSITHEWSGSGGCLEINDNLSNTKYRGNSWSAWNETTPRHRKFIDKIVSSKLHIIATMRSKTETAQEGKKIFKVGTKTEQRDGMEYEFTTVFDISHEGHFAVVSKDRTNLFNNGQPFIIDQETGKKLNEWLNTGKNYYMSQEHQVELNNLLSALPQDKQNMISKKYPSFAEQADSRFEEIKLGLIAMIEQTKQAEQE